MLIDDQNARRSNRPSIALALGGGGARGLAHILMLEVFDELGLRPSVITGTSIGAIFGAAYAAGLPARLIRAHAEEALSMRLDLLRHLISARADPVQRLFNLLPLRAAVLKPETLLDLVLPSRMPADFADLAIPLKVVATDFYAQEAVVISKGPLRPAIAASMALPGLFQPVFIEGRALVDGGLVNPLPFDLLVGAADVTVAVDVSGAAHQPHATAVPRAFEALLASSQILQRAIVREKLKSIRPDVWVDVDVDAYHVLEFYRFREILAAAEPAKVRLKQDLARVMGLEQPEPAPAAIVVRSGAASGLEGVPEAEAGLPRPRKTRRLALPGRKRPKA